MCELTNRKFIKYPDKGCIIRKEKTEILICLDMFSSKGLNMKQRYYIGLDVGTSSLKTILINSRGKILAISNNRYPVYAPKQGWSEQDPQDWWRACIKGIKNVIDVSGISSQYISAIGLSGQMHGAVFLADGIKPLRRAILWNDQRTAKQCEYIEKKAGGRKKLIEMTGNPALTGFTAPKIIWLRDNELQIYKKVKHVLLPKDYIRFRLTGQYATDVSDASGMLLVDIKKRKWHDRLIDKLELSRDWFAKCYESSEITGFVTSNVARMIGLPSGLPVVAGAGDQSAGAVGTGIVSTGIVSATIGTSGVVFAYSDNPQFDSIGRMHTMCHAIKGKWCIFGCMLSAGGALQWAKDTLYPNMSYDELISSANKAPIGCEGLFFLPYLTGERTPHADPYARACFIGLASRTDRNSIIRAVIEGVTFGMKTQVDIIRELGIKIKQIRLSGGGAKNKFWRQMQADMYNAPVLTVNTTEGSAFGAAILAVVGIGEYDSVAQACLKMIKTRNLMNSIPENVKIYQQNHKIYDKLYYDLKCDFSELAKLF